jgi:transposase
MGRKAHKPTPENRSQVEALAAFGIRQEHIAEMIGASLNTLNKYYRRELEFGLSKANAKVANSLFRKAIGEGREAAICAMFWLKTRAGWKETNIHQHEGKNGGAIQMLDAAALSRLSDGELETLESTLARLAGASEPAGADQAGEGTPGG